ncbi:hypothetical protein predicted by Glimmer/Critica [Lactiplantibacillus plantarum]|nr:hypothetical protein predicted by Glimmer/Critica [Lactiplantibacillus plantarum]
MFATSAAVNYGQGGLAVIPQVKSPYWALPMI